MPTPSDQAMADMLEFISRRSLDELRDLVSDPDKVDGDMMAKLGALTGIASLHMPHNLDGPEVDLSASHCETCSTDTYPCATMSWIAAAWRTHEDYDKTWMPPVPKIPTTSK